MLNCYLVHMLWRYRIIAIIGLLLPNFVLAGNLQIVEGASKQIGVTRFYDPSYVTLVFPNGDVPLDRGVCSDVVIRALRHTGQDLQVLVNQDMKAHFNAYPKIWRLKTTDRNIDHRRVPNLETYFTGRGMSLPLTTQSNNFQPGDIVSWRLDNGLPHIGVISAIKNSDNRPLVIHNIGSGARLEDVLFSWKMVGHYRYYKTI